MQSDLNERQHHWVPKEKRKMSFGPRKNKSEPCLKQTHFPLTLPWAW